MPRNLPRLDPSSRTGRDLAVSCALKHLCPLAARKDALEPWQRNGCGLFGIPSWRSSSVPLHYPTPTKDSKLDGTCWLSAQPPYSPSRRLTLCLWQFSTTWAPFRGPPPLPQLSPSSSFFSSNWGWGVGQL